MKLYYEDDRIYFHHESVNKLGYTNFNQELWNLIKDKKFTVEYKTMKDGTKKAKYIKCSKLKKTLHQIVIDFYYGEEIRKKMYEKKFIIEHHDNDGFNCLIENLSFLSAKRNTSKGFGYDIDRIRLLDMIAINIFKNFETQKYQITLGFNRPVYLSINGKNINLATMYFAYSDNFKIVINDATNILDLLEEYEKLDLTKLNFESYTYKEVTEINILDEEKLAPILFKDGTCYLNMDSPYQSIKKIAPMNELYENSK